MPDIKRITSPSLSEPEPPLFCNCLVVGDQIIMSGMTAGDGKGGVLGDGSPYDQARQCFLKIETMLEAAGATLDDAVKFTYYLTDMAYRSDLARARQEFLVGRETCATLVEVSGLANPGIFVEIDAIAFIGATRV